MGIGKVGRDKLDLAADIDHARQLFKQPADTLDMLDEMVAVHPVHTGSWKLGQDLVNIPDDIHAWIVECIDPERIGMALIRPCLLYTSDAADE